MRDWHPAPREIRCGGVTCGGRWIAAGAPVLVIRIPGTTHPHYRCVDCAARDDEHPPAALDPLPPPPPAAPVHWEPPPPAHPPRPDYGVRHWAGRHDVKQWASGDD